jgi:hypothetical protein
MDEVLTPAIYEIAVGWDADKPIVMAYAMAETLEEALKCAKEFLGMHPWPKDTPRVLSIKLLCNAEYLIVSRKYAQRDSFRM